MRGFVGFTLALASVAWLIPWPAAWPATVAAIVVAWLIVPNPRDSGGQLNGRSEG